MKDVPATRSRRRTIKPDIVHVLFRPDLGKQVRELALRERRTISAQVQVLVERALGNQESAA